MPRPYRVRPQRNRFFSCVHCLRVCRLPHFPKLREGLEETQAQNAYPILIPCLFPFGVVCELLKSSVDLLGFKFNIFVSIFYRGKWNFIMCHIIRRAMSGCPISNTGFHHLVKRTIVFPHWEGILFQT